MTKCYINWSFFFGRGQDKRRMNIRLTGDMPNYFAKALESPFEKDVYTRHNTDMVSNNKRSSKEYEKDLSYSFSNVNAVIDYPTTQSGISQINTTRLTRSTADISEYKDNLSRLVLYLLIFSSRFHRNY